MNLKSEFCLYFETEGVCHMRMIIVPNSCRFKHLSILVNYDKGPPNMCFGQVKHNIKENYYYKRKLLLTLLSINYTISMH